jgi:hypothetical protein
MVSLPQMPIVAPAADTSILTALAQRGRQAAVARHLVRHTQRLSPRCALRGIARRKTWNSRHVNKPLHPSAGHCGNKRTGPTPHPRVQMTFGRCSAGLLG